MNEERALNVVFATDDGFAMVLGVALTSLIENAIFKDYKLNIIIMDSGISGDNKEKLIATLSANDKITYLFYDVLARLDC